MPMRAAFGVVVSGGVVVCQWQPASVLPPATPPAPSTKAPESQIAPDLPPLAANLNMSGRPAEVVRAAYEFAARHPEVLRYVPCFCGCERGGHQGNADCFVGARDKQGKGTE